MPMGTDVVIDGYMVNPHVVAERAVTTTDIVYLLTIDSCLFMKSDQTHHLTPIFFSGQAVRILTRFINHGKGQPSNQDVPSTRNLAGFWKRNSHRLSGQAFESCLILGMLCDQVFFDITGTLFKMFCHLFYSEDMSIEKAGRVSLSPLLVHKL